MREILFRGKRLDNGEWVEGLLWRKKYKHNKLFISYFPNKDDDEKCVVVDPETVCQYTGMIDSNGNKIWEYDLIKFEDTGEDGYEYKEGYEFTNIAMVEFFEGRWQLGNFAEDNSGVLESMEREIHCEFIGIFRCSEVIGNIFDNPELLKGGAE